MPHGHCFHTLYVLITYGTSTACPLQVGVNEDFRAAMENLQVMILLLTLSCEAFLREFHTNSTTAAITAIVSPVTSTTNIPPTLSRPEMHNTVQEVCHTLRYAIFCSS